VFQEKLEAAKILLYTNNKLTDIILCSASNGFISWVDEIPVLY